VGQIGQILVSLKGHHGHAVLIGDAVHLAAAEPRPVTQSALNGRAKFTETLLLEFRTMRKREATRMAAKGVAVRRRRSRKRD
jgi:hypothetical protein